MSFESVTLLDTIQEYLKVACPSARLVSEKEAVLCYTGKRLFCTLVHKPGKIKMYLDIPKEDLIDKKFLSQDCSESEKEYEGKTLVIIQDDKNTEYAVDLIRQSYDY